MQKHYHFIGIGGIGMSGLARILLRKGEKVSGSDLKRSALVDDLKREGALVSIGHSAKNIKGSHAVIYSTDIAKENVEYRKAEEKSIPLLHRSELLAQMMGGYAPLLVTGTHGKTTTASLLAHMLLEAGLDPSFSIGGHLIGHQNARYGTGLYFAAEADESDGTFLNYPSFGAIITNLEPDHMDYWKEESKILKAFQRFSSQVGSKKHLFWCYDDLRLRSLKIKGSSFGFDEKADLVINNFRQVEWGVIFDISFEGKKYQEVEIPLIGAHNVMNSSSVFGLGLKLDISENVIRSGLKSFKGVGRRFEKKGECQGIVIYDDYAHHPTEIFSTLRAMKSIAHGKRIVVAFQPHRYSRTKYCMNDFADAFEYADEVILTEIYAAQESPLYGITAEALLERIQEGGFEPVSYVERKKLPHYLSKFLKKGDLLVTMGAGDITFVGPAVLEALEKQ
ncbi:MAG: UDP-N-acetylmuramate--L-alanine ligase [Chlamydiae bacterium]|nr:UDP-N-acetylmuramate--L-alanine ligase [Chlamydiota bacterium]